MYQCISVSVDLGIGVIQGLKFKRWVIISMTIMCNAILIIKYDERRLGLPMAPLGRKYDSSSIEYDESRLELPIAYGTTPHET